MGGYGSGPHSNQPDTSEAKRIDIRYLREHRLMQPSHFGSLTWTCRGSPRGDISYRVAHDASSLTLDYKVRQNGEDWQPINCIVPLTTTPCRYGGERHYFLCPNRHCSRRCEVLYFYGVHFLCRNCCHYLYPSQKGDKLDKLLEAKRKIGARIFEDWDGSDGWRKVRGMRWRTFEREYQRFQALDAAWNIAFYDLAKVMGINV